MHSSIYEIDSIKSLDQFPGLQGKLTSNSPCLLVLSGELTKRLIMQEILNIRISVLEMITYSGLSISAYLFIREACIMLLGIWKQRN